MIEEVMPHLPAERPHYLMGVGTPDDLLEAVSRGVDMFDCVLPTRNGRHGTAFTRFGAINMKNARHADDPRPLDARSRCPAARDYPRAYLHHLARTNEMLGAMLLSLVNLYYYQDLMAGMRAAIAERRFDEFRASDQGGWATGDIPPPSDFLTRLSYEDAPEFLWIEPYEQTENCNEICRCARAAGRADPFCLDRRLCTNLSRPPGPYCTAVRGRGE